MRSTAGERDEVASVPQTPAQVTLGVVSAVLVVLGRASLGLNFRSHAMICLAAAAILLTGRVGRGVFIGKKKKDADQWSIAPVSDPATVLARLLEVFWEGVHGFIPFAPQSSDAFAAEYRKWGDAARAMRAAKKEWVGGFRTFPESNDFCLRLALGRRRDLRRPHRPGRCRR